MSNLWNTLEFHNNYNATEAPEANGYCLREASDDTSFFVRAEREMRRSGDLVNFFVPDDKEQEQTYEPEFEKVLEGYYIPVKVKTAIKRIRFNQIMSLIESCNNSKQLYLYSQNYYQKQKAARYTLLAKGKHQLVKDAFKSTFAELKIKRDIAIEQVGQAIKDDTMSSLELRTLKRDIYKANLTYNQKKAYWDTIDDRLKGAA